MINTFKNIPVLFVKDMERATDLDDDRLSLDRTIEKNYSLYLASKEAIIDTLLLSKCNYLIRSYSALSDIAIIFNENIQEVF